MEKKRLITIYKDFDGPYIDAMRVGMMESPRERFEKFFQIRRQFQHFTGQGGPSGDRKITIRKAEWI